MRITARMELVKACKMVPVKREALFLLCSPISSILVQHILVEPQLGVWWLEVGCPEQPVQSCRGTGGKCGNNWRPVMCEEHSRWVRVVGTRDQGSCMEEGAFTQG